MKTFLVFCTKNQWLTFIEQENVAIINKTTNSVIMNNDDQYIAIMNNNPDMIRGMALDGVLLLRPVSLETYEVIMPMLARKSY